MIWGAVVPLPGPDQDRHALQLAVRTGLGALL